VVLGSPAIVGFGQFLASRHFFDRDFEALGRPVTQYLHRDRVARFDPGHFESQVTAIGDLLAVEFGDDIASFQAGLVCRASRSHLADQGAGVILELEFPGQTGSQVLDHDAQVTAGNMAIFYQVFHHIAGEVHRDGEANALVAARAAENGGVDSDQASFGVNERAPGVARVDGGIGLDEIFVIQAHRARPTHRANDSGGYRLPDAERVADGQYHVAHFDLVAVSHGHRRQIFRIDFDHGDIALGVAADHFGGEFPSVLHRYFNLVRAIHDVVVRQDVTVAGYNNAGADAGLTRQVEVAARRASVRFIAEKAPEKVVEAGL